jgi:hypothetical protein
VTGRSALRRVLVLPQEIAGVASGLVRGLRENGVDADLLVRTQHPFAYDRPAPSTAGLRRVQDFVAKASPNDGPRGRLSALFSLFARVAVLPWLWWRYDAFVYLGPTTLSGLAAERRVARFLGRPVVTVFLGSDARPPYLSGFFTLPADGSQPDLADVRRRTRAVSRRVRAAESSSTYVVNHPPTAQFHRERFVDFSTMGIPVPDLSGSVIDTTTTADRSAVRVIHAPSMAPWKGTDQIRAAVDALRDEGLAIDYVELSGVPHRTVIESLADADLVVDELYSDAFLAGLATEAAAVGCPPLVFGYAAAELAPVAATLGADLRHYNAPDDLLATLRNFVTSAELRSSVGAALQVTVEQRWSASAVAARYLMLLRGQPDPSWFRDPASIAYVAGWGVEKVARRAFLKRYLAAGGVTDLQLEPDSPALRAILEEQHAATGPTS